MADSTATPEAIRSDKDEEDKGKHQDQDKTKEQGTRTRSNQSKDSSKGQGTGNKDTDSKTREKEEVDATKTIEERTTVASDLEKSGTSTCETAAVKGFATTTGSLIAAGAGAAAPGAAAPEVGSVISGETTGFGSADIRSRLTQYANQ
ncbi:hypothetical protein ISF_01766 [Cordyceps fumosorosea ARSEF 2679]|uniref:Uncharacterized protein n=1 Tax=Cordyceps fumosorosea (strain ARSEF 2679) TaxID=1081104 RepID=A0A168CCA0_CORFA|nr:hypothetical protein ISF_01766 [Cordyceps fumosorosea ARSEF 2679]OAA71215.1 hypothetical protein ISF_01766 [Cordyceps fumosorosea ARSEF 2679]